MAHAAAAIAGQGTVFVPTSTVWVVIDTFGNGFTTLAALLAAAANTDVTGAVAAADCSGIPWPGLDPGMTPSAFFVRSRTAANVDGSPFYIALNQAAAFSNLASDTVRDKAAYDMVSGGGQTFSSSGVTPFSFNQVHNCWLRKTAGADIVILTWQP
jgi:hypothetical protein